MLNTPLFTFLILVATGAVVGFVFNRQGRSWLGRQVDGAIGAGDTTYAIVSIAGSFMAYHVGLIVTGLTTPLLYVAALIGAASMIFVWRGR